MTKTELDILIHPLCSNIIEDNIDVDPVRIASSKPIARSLAEQFGDGSPALSLIATQVKYLQRARVKLPQYFQARCIVPPLAFEQAGSSECAAHKSYNGKLCIDLTCGLGVDSVNFAQHFTRVISVERDPVLARLAQHNFSKLGIENIEVIAGSAEDFLARTDLKADLIYVDPDRRDLNNRKLVLLEDCSPDVVSLHDRMHRIAERVVIKCSPLFDPAEAFRIFPEHTMVEAISLRGECKELLIETGKHIAEPIKKASIAGGESLEISLSEIKERIEGRFDPPYRYLLLPDVSLRKMRMARDRFSSSRTYISNDNGYAFSNILPEGDMYCHYEIESIHSFNPKALKRLLSDRGIRRINIMQRDFSISNESIARQISVREGGATTVAFCTVDGKQLAVILRNC